MDISEDPITFLKWYGFKVNKLDSIPYDAYKHKFSFPKSSSHSIKDYWEKRIENFTESSQIDFNLKLEKRIRKIVRHYERLAVSFDVPAEGLPVPKNFYGPFLPTVSDLKALADLRIEVNWLLSEQHSTDDIELKDWDGDYKKGLFSKQENELLYKRWKKFQKKYKFYDLRPLVEERVTLITDECGELSFYSIRYLSMAQKRNFLRFIGKYLPNRPLRRICNHMRDTLDMFKDGCFSDCAQKVKPGEFHLITAFLEKYGFNPNGLSVVLKKRSAHKVSSICGYLHRIKHIPLKSGAWSEKEDELLLRAIARLYPKMSLLEIINQNKPIHWKKIFEVLQHRSPKNLFNHWKNLKQTVYSSMLSDDVPQLCHDDIIRLIKFVHASGADDKVRIDWSSMTKEFPGLVDYELKDTYFYFYQKKVPKSIRKFSDGAKYLYKTSLEAKKPLLRQRYNKNKAERMIQYRNLILSIDASQNEELHSDNLEFLAVEDLFSDDYSTEQSQQTLKDKDVPSASGKRPFKLLPPQDCVLFQNSPRITRTIDG